MGVGKYLTCLFVGASKFQILGTRNRASFQYDLPYNTREKTECRSNEYGYPNG